jgi:hypothetical protein
MIDGKFVWIPEVYHDGYVYGKYEDGNLAITATITPPVMISEPHIDQPGSMSLLIQLLGKKLFVVWKLQLIDHITEHLNIAELY